ncbi:MAG: MMPL family transporter [Mycobacteriaceae bacterium]|nr:MMPL family transporter [Mycobacteriaceae bacterium]
MAAAAVLGAPGSHTFSTGGFGDPNAESTKATRLLVKGFHLGDLQLILLVRAPEPVDTPAARKSVEELAAQLRAADHVATVTSPWDSPDPAEAGLISRDKRSALIVAGIEGGETQSGVYAAELADRFSGEHDGGITVSAGGTGIGTTEITEQTRRDLSVSEAIALPISFIVLFWVFGGLVAAMIPLAVGCFAILGSMAILRLLAGVTEVSVFAVNLAVCMGLALAIDYSLLIVSRYREEIGAGAQPEEAINRTLRTAGRTVTYSAVTVGLCLAVMAFFPMYAVRSLAYGGVAVVVFAALASVFVAPATILVSGERIAKGRVRRGLPANMWYRWARAVMRRPGISVVATAVPLLVVALPFLHARFGFPDDRILPPTSTARQVGDQIRANFNQDLASAIQVVIPATGHLSGTQIRSYAAELSRTPGVVAVSSPDATLTGGTAVGPPSGPTGTHGGVVLLTIATRAALFSSESNTLLNNLHAVPAPTGTTVWFGGLEQTNRDSIESIAARLPVVLGSIAAVMLGLLFMLTRSVIIPVKALGLNVLSLSATFGAMVWVFQQGHLRGLGTTVVGVLLAIVPVLMFCVAFGLSMDYEVFLISRMREFWLASDKTRAANNEAVSLGLASTGRVVTAAALIMAITFAALSASKVSLMRIFGVGLTLAVLLDATIIRMVLLPATMTLLGQWNWWAPRLAQQKWLSGHNANAPATSRTDNKSQAR